VTDYKKALKETVEWWRLPSDLREEYLRDDQARIAAVDAKRARRQRRPQGSGMESASTVTAGRT
jgi:hypothetical protein